MKMKLRHDRIAQAIETLEYVYTHRARKFDMGVWLTLKYAERAALIEGTEEGKEDSPLQVAINGCGTQACALGWIASNPYAIKRGLFVGFIPGQQLCEVYFKDQATATGAARLYFGITEATADMLFMPTYYKHDRGRTTLKAVIARMRCLLDAPTPELGEIAVADACACTGVDERDVAHIWRGY